MKHQPSLERRVQTAVQAHYWDLKAHPRDYTGPLNEHFVRSVAASVQIRGRLERWPESDAVLKTLAVSEAKRYLAWLGTAGTPRKS